MIYIYVAIGIALFTVGSLTLKKRLPQKLNQGHLNSRWHELQARCANKAEWYLAIVDADKLLDDVLKRRRYRGKTTGERLVRAQHILTDNESVWFGHKLRNRIVQEQVKQISKQDTLEALSGFRRALKDLGAFRDQSGKNEEGQ